MAEFLLELFCEEIPARMQSRAADDLARLVTAGFAEAGLTGGAVRAFATPRRLALVIDDLPTETPDVKEERKGPKADAPEKAIEGFLRSTGLTRDQLEERETKKGNVLFAVIEREGRAAAAVIADVVPQVVRNFPWLKSMRWGSGSLRWVRPLQNILCVLDGKTVSFDIDGLHSNDQTFGHRFMAPAAITVTGFDQYKRALYDAKVVLDGAERAAMIAQKAGELAEAAGLALVESDALARENAGLNEWPTPMLGRFDEAFLDVPAEVLTATMAKDQKYFATQDPQTGKLANGFILTSNLIADDGGVKIVDGNQRVIRARLSDAQFFWQQDKKTTLESRLPQLDDIVFHQKLGTVRQRVDRMVTLSGVIAAAIGGDKAQAERAALLAKCDLVSQMVYEFPEVQGVMGGYFARNDGEPAAVATAIESHYQPAGPDDDCPTDKVAIAVAMADKLDTLAGFFAIDEKPTGSKDPFALRRAALGVIRLILENDLRVNLAELFKAACAAHKLDDVSADLLAFFEDRLKVHLRADGVRHDLVAASFALAGQDDLVLILKRVSALAELVQSDDGKNLLAASKRGGNILSKEEKKDGASYCNAPDPALFKDKQEQALADALAAADGVVVAALSDEDFAGAVAALAKLRAPLDEFFDSVTVNDDDPKVRVNRLCLLAQIRALLGQVADFSLIEG